MGSEVTSGLMSRALILILLLVLVIIELLRLWMAMRVRLLGSPLLLVL